MGTRTSVIIHKTEGKRYGGHYSRNQKLIWGWFETGSIGMPFIPRKANRETSKKQNKHLLCPRTRFATAATTGTFVPMDVTSSMGSTSRSELTGEGRGPGRREWGAKKQKKKAALYPFSIVSYCVCALETIYSISVPAWSASW